MRKNQNGLFTDLYDYLMISMLCYQILSMKLMESDELGD